MSVLRFKIILFLALVGSYLAACAPTADNSLITDEKNQSSLMKVDKTPKSEELYLKLDTASIGKTITSEVLEVSGECYTSTYPRHRILVRENSNQLRIIDTTASTQVGSNEAQCRNGRFNFTLNAKVLATGSHQVRVALEAFDGLNTLVVNSGQGAATLAFTK